MKRIAESENIRRDRLLAERFVDAYQAGWDAGYTGEAFAEDIRPSVRQGRAISPERVQRAAARLGIEDDREFGPFPRFVKTALHSLTRRLRMMRGAA